MASNTPTAFVSYSRVDSEFALQLVKDLKAAGANVWLDQLDIEPGTPWDSAIEDALLGSTHMLVVLSTISVTSDNVRDEVSYALSQQMKVIPVLYRECKVPFRLARLQHIDFRNDYSVALKSLLKTLRVEQQVTSSSTPSHEDDASLAEAAERQRRDEDRIQAQHAEQLAQQAQWEEERKQREQAEVTRQAVSARQAEIARQAQTARLAEAERQRATAALAEQTKRQQQEIRERTSKNAPPPEPITPGTSAPSPLSRIAIYALVTGLLRVICSFAAGLLVRPFGYRLANPISTILIGAITGFILYRVLLLFKPELPKKQIRAIPWLWVAAGVALAAIGFDPIWLSISPLAPLVFALPATIAGTITGRILSRALHAPSKGIVIGIVSFGIPVFSGQLFLRMLRSGSYVSYWAYRDAIIAVNFCVATIEVGLLLWFIRNWGQRSSTSSTAS